MPKATSAISLPLIPAGIHRAVCYAVIDIGTQPSQMYAPSRKVMLIWELPDERSKFKDDSGKEVVKPRVINAEYTLSTGKKANLRRDLESWRGKPFTEEEAKSFEVGVLAGVNCQLNIVHKPSRDGSKTYARVTGVVPLGKGMVKATPENKILVYDIPEQGEIDFPETMPEWIVNKIKQSEEYRISIGEIEPHREETDAEEDLSAFPGSGGSEEYVPF